jgi:hypothetical protein
VRALREIYDFITGGSIVAPIGLFCAITAAVFAPPPWRAPALVTFVAAAFAGSVFERPT